MSVARYLRLKFIVVACSGLMRVIVFAVSNRAQRELRDWEFTTFGAAPSRRVYKKGMSSCKTSIIINFECYECSYSANSQLEFKASPFFYTFTFFFNNRISTRPIVNVQGFLVNCNLHSLSMQTKYTVHA